MNSMPNLVALFLPWFLFLSSFLGVFLFPGHLISYFICIELLLLASSVSFSLFSLVLDDSFGFRARLVSLAAAAAESALGLALLVAYNRFHGDIVVSIPYVKGLFSR